MNEGYADNHPDNGIRKIGRCINMIRRESSYKCGNLNMTIIESWPVYDCINMEKIIHKMWNSIRVWSSLEWFYAFASDEEMVHRLSSIIIPVNEEMKPDRPALFRNKYINDFSINLPVERKPESKDEFIEILTEEERSILVKECLERYITKTKDSPVLKFKDSGLREDLKKIYGTKTYTELLSQKDKINQTLAEINESLTNKDNNITYKIKY